MKIFVKLPEVGANLKLLDTCIYFSYRRALLLFYFIFMVPFLIFAQKIDSLNSLLKSDSGRDRMNILYQLAYEYIDVDNRLAVRYATESFVLAKAQKDEDGIVRAGIVKSLALSRIGEEDSSLLLANQILPIARKKNQTKELIKILNRLGAAMSYKGQYDKALMYHFESLQIRERTKDKFEISVTLNNIGFIYYQLEDYDKALSYYEKSLKLKDEIDNKYDLDVLLANMSLCYIYKGNFTEARKFIEKGLNLCGSDCSSKVLMRAFYNLGLISLRLRKDVEATSEFLKSYELAKELGDKRFQLDNIIYLSQVYIRQDQLDLAEKYLENAEVLIDSGIPYNLELIKIYHELFSLYKKSRNFEKVAYYQEKYILLKDSVYNEELTTNLMKVEAEYLERENKAKIEAQTEILVLNNEVISRQRILNIFVGIVSVLLFAIAVILIRSNRQKARSNIQLEMKVKERTLELEVNAELLQRSLYESKQQLQRMFFHVKSSLATINGLCTLGLRDGNKVTTDQYIEKIKTTSDHLLAELSPSLVAHSVAE